MTRLSGRLEITVRLRRAGNSDFTTGGIATSKNRHGAPAARSLTGLAAGACRPREEQPGVEPQPLRAVSCS